MVQIVFKQNIERIDCDCESECLLLGSVAFPLLSGSVHICLGYDAVFNSFVNNFFLIKTCKNSQIEIGRLIHQQ